MDENPFTKLLSSTTAIKLEEKSSSETNFQNIKINSLVEFVFELTLDKDYKNVNRPMILMEDAAESSSMWTIELLENSLFERLLMPIDLLKSLLLPKQLKNFDESTIDSQVISYLFSSFRRAETRQNETKDTAIQENCDKIKKIIGEVVSTAIKQPDIFVDQLSLAEQFSTILKNSINEEVATNKFLIQVVNSALADNDVDSYTAVKNIFFSVFDDMLKQVKKASLTTLDKWILTSIECCVKQNPKLAELLLKHSTPPANSLGVKYSESLFGQLLCLSIMPKNNNGPYEYYDNLLHSNITAVNNLSSTLWNYLTSHTDALTQIFKTFLLLGNDLKSGILDWFGSALHANEKRGQIWNTHGAMLLGINAPDSFMVNLSGVLLRLCQPLFKPQLKVLLVDPTYTAVAKPEELTAKQVHMKDLHKITCLQPPSEDRITAEKYNFITECFFMTHKAIDLGYRVCFERLKEKNREIQRLQGAYQDAANQGNPDVIMQSLSTNTQQYLCLQNLLLEPKNDEMMMNLYEATSIWIMQLAMKSKVEEAQKDKGFAPIKADPVVLPLTNETFCYMEYIPECLLENLVDYLHFGKIFNVQNLNAFNGEARKAIFTLMVPFMGNPLICKNPHLRARLAEGLESFLPRENSSRFQINSAIFEEHEHRLQVVQNLLNVFVKIEISGETVQFEQKFNYRRPMYAIMEYLWKIPEQKNCFKQLAKLAEERIEDIEVPIFLRFINLLINDAIFLLDESLNNLQQIKTLELARDNHEWDTLPQNERAQNMANLHQLGMFAKFNNILGKDTINMLRLLTSEIKGIFCHSSMVDRISAMLNYFLLTLVGPGKEKFKVKDKKEYEFDPAVTVKTICQIYLNLKDSEEFCLAILKDGRSYSNQLFKYTENVLIKICPSLITEIQEFAQKLNLIEQQHKESEEALFNPPDEFLDPIMSTLMRDPVILPSSKINIDRSTIARHLLSDPSDPFNRSPLSMDQLKPNFELKAQIEEWIKEKMKNIDSSKSNSS